MRPLGALALTLAVTTVAVLGNVQDAVTASAPVPGLQHWEARMVTTGRALCNLLGQPGTTDQLLPQVYYDAERVFFQIADYTGDPAWGNCAKRAEAVYRDRYVLPSQGAVPGYWNFTRGLAMDYLRSGDRSSRDAVILLAENAAFARDGTPPAWTVSADYSREVAYAILSYLDAESVGAPRRARLALLVDQALGHIQQWFVARTATRIAPFMVGLTAEALIAYYERTHDPRIPPAIQLAMDWLWAYAWLPGAEAFWYDSNSISAGGAPDLNLLIAPAYAWLYRQTGDPAYRDRADRIFVGGVEGANLGHGKQFDQNYRWSFDYVRWRRGAGALAPRGAPTSGVDGRWTNAWTPLHGVFWDTGSDPTVAAPDLSLLIAPAYAWLCRPTGDLVYRDRGHQVVAVGSRPGVLADWMQFN